MANPWLDTRQGVPENERIKAIASETVSGQKHTAFADPKGPKRLVFRTSADGATFRKLSPQPELISDLPNCFDGGNTRAHRKTTLMMDAIDRKSIHHRGFSYVLGASNWVSRTNYPLTGILPCGPDRMMLFVARHYMEASWHIERLLLRTDGFASVRAPWEGGEMISKPLTFEGAELEINYRTGAA